MSKDKAYYIKRSRLNKLENKEIPELSRIQREMKSLADKGSAADAANLPFIEAGLKRAHDEVVKLKAALAKMEGTFGSIWIKKADDLEKEES